MPQFRSTLCARMAFSLAFTPPASRLVGALFHERLQRIALDPHGAADAGRLDLLGVNELPQCGSGEIRVGFCLLVVQPCGSNGYLLVVFGHDTPPFKTLRFTVNQVWSRDRSVGKKKPRTCRGIITRLAN